MNLEWQIAHYTQRLLEATDTKEKAFLRKTLYELKKSLWNG